MISRSSISSVGTIESEGMKRGSAMKVRIPTAMTIAMTKIITFSRWDCQKLGGVIGGWGSWAIGVCSKDVAIA